MKFIHLNTQISSAALLQRMSHEKRVAESFVRKNPASILPWKRTFYRKVEAFRTTGRHRDKPEKQDGYLWHRRLCAFVYKVSRCLRTHVTYFHILNIIICILPNMCILALLTVHLKTLTLRKLHINTWEVLKCDDGEGWRSGGPIVWEMKK
jgi:hypothetical protein